MKLPLALTALIAAIPCMAFAGGLADRLWTPEHLAHAPGESRSGPLTAPDPMSPGTTRLEHPVQPLPSERRGSIRRVDTGGRKLVALTFDLCELADKKAGYDGEVVDVLRREGVAATFFAGGRWLKTHPERAMQLMADPLFEVGNHAWTHGNFGVLDPERMREQVLWTMVQYEALRRELAARAEAAGAGELMARVPLVPAALRFPYGRCSPEALALLAELGVAAVQWDVNSMDADKARTPESFARLVTAGVKPGSIVLAHANGNGHGTAGGVALTVAALKAKGYEFVTVSALLAAGKPVTAGECYDSRPGDTKQYDAIFGDGTVHPKRK